MGLRRSVLMTAAVAAAVAATSGCTASGTTARAGAGGLVANPYIADARVGEHASVFAGGDGDLWPNCWAKDGDVYAAYGDGKGFGDEASDIGVARISGAPLPRSTNDGSGHGGSGHGSSGHGASLNGTTLAVGDGVGQVWSGDDFTRKPTGMTCVGDTLYLAVQDLRKDFNEAPAATIARSDDGGRTWTWDRSAPMFHDHVFTTIFFADFGRDGAWAKNARVGDYVYAYGLDGNWRDSFDDSVPDPRDLYLARVPKDRLQDRSAWEFVAGMRGTTPIWSPDIRKKSAVLHDARLRHPSRESASGGETVGASNLTVISQGGVLYDEPMKTYIYTSWTELTFEFYAAKHPWGPWKLFYSHDWGAYPWPHDSYGGYGTTIPSKFLSANGRSAWLQANVCPCAPAGVQQYDFGLRRLDLSPVTG